MKWNEMLPWLIPLLLIMASGGVQVYSLLDRVDAIELRNNTRGEAALQELNEIKHRVVILENYFCSKVEGCDK